MSGLTAGQVALALMVGQQVYFANGNAVTKVSIEPGAAGVEPLVLITDVDGDVDAYATTEVVEGAERRDIVGVG